jgi:hypothetical protein
MALENLTSKERALYNGFLVMNNGVKECTVHVTAYMAGEVLGNCPYKFEMKDWSTVDPRMKDCDACTTPFSQEIHDTINSLEKKCMLARDPDNPQVLYVAGPEVMN